MTPDGGAPLGSILAEHTGWGANASSLLIELGLICGMTMRIIAEAREQPCRKRVSGIVWFKSKILLRFSVLFLMCVETAFC
jgi:predicted MFS family arabinose efflux permease